MKGVDKSGSLKLVALFLSASHVSKAMYSMGIAREIQRVLRETESVMYSDVP